MSCDADEPALVWPAKDPDDKLDYYASFERHLARQWEPFTDFASGTRIRVYGNSKSAGFEFSSSGGRSGGRPPVWPEALAATVIDGSITWTGQALSTSSLRTTISGTPTWTADTGVTVSAEAVSGNIASALIEGGTDGEDYTVLVKATFADGTSKTAVCVLPVRRAVRVCDA